ncbi:threonine/serine exporter family protein [Allobaculum mucilyticum]|nr:threonine/serine exporter family protein [Allobaculum mucilyticum]UNT96598.1 threonine/serine exporter family protein [Allobaculum mucilyticum]
MELEDTSRLATVIMRTGKLLLASGGDVVSVKQAMKTVCKTHSDAKKPEAIVGSNTITFSFKVHHQIITRVCEVKKIGNDITHIEMIHDFCEHCADMSLDQMEKALDEIENTRPVARWIRVLASGICSAGFGLFLTTGWIHLIFSDWTGSRVDFNVQSQSNHEYHCRQFLCHDYSNSAAENRNPYRYRENGSFQHASDGAGHGYVQCNSRYPER